MPGPLFVGAEGVILLPDKESYAASRPVNEGLELVLMLKEFPTSSLTVICHTDNQEGAEHFVRMHGLPRARVLTTPAEDRAEYTAQAQLHALNRERARGSINLVLTAFKEVYDRCTVAHQNVLLFSRRGALASLGDQIPWDDMQARVKMANEARIEEENKDEANGVT